jgi:hypothetical protein
MCVTQLAATASYKHRGVMRVGMTRKEIAAACRQPHVTNHTAGADVGWGAATRPLV